MSSSAADEAPEQLQGEWLLTSIVVHGQTLPAPAGKGGSILFGKAGKLIMKDPGKPDRLGKYTIKGGTIPKHIDLIESADGKDARTMRGIYEIDGDTLRLGFPAEGPKGQRPRDFKGEKVVIVQLKRQNS